MKISASMVSAVRLALLNGPSRRKMARRSKLIGRMLPESAMDALCPGDARVTYDHRRAALFSRRSSLQMQRMLRIHRLCRGPHAVSGRCPP